MVENVGVLGLGAMGSRFTRRLLDTGYRVHVWNRSPANAEGLAAAGAEVAPSPRAVAERSNVLLSMVWDSVALQQIAYGAEGFVAGLRAGQVVVDSSTVEPEVSAAVAANVAATGARMLDGPVSGSLDAAEEGRVLFMIGGPADALANARPVLEALARSVVHVGERNGSGLALKLAVNMQVAAQAVAWGEALALSERFGIDRERAAAVMLESVIASPMIRYRAPFVVDPPEEVWASAEQLLKDVTYAVERSGGTAVSGRYCQRLLQRLVDEGRGGREAAELMVAAAEGLLCEEKSR
jgi:3-hydroxyisobutyrate dehydrogenase-like beta-hydroxyacid dehydrogenase